MIRDKEKQNIPKGWIESELGSLAHLYQPETISKNQMDSNGEYLVFGANGIIGRYNKFNHENPEVVVTCRGASCGSVSLTPDKAWITGNAMVVSPDESKLSKGYLFYLLKHSPLQAVVTGGAQPQITRGPISLLKVRFPESKTEQQKIAEIFGAVDEDITKTKEVIAATEKLKRGLMQRLFTRGIGHTKFKETELGEIPEMWDVVLLDDVAKRGSGHTPSKKVVEYYNGGIKWVSLADSNKLDHGEIVETKIEISDEGIKHSSAVMHPKGTVLISRDAGIGRCAVMGEDMAVSQHFMTWTCGERLNNWYLYYYLQSLKKEFERIAIGSTIKTIGLPYFKKLQIPLPNIEEQKHIASVFLSIDEKVVVNKKLLAKLTELKKGLMQDLLSGKVRVK